MKHIFITGPVPPQLIADSIAAHSKKQNIGAHSIFLGQVRNDQAGDAQVTAIEYSAYEAMALEQMHLIREDVITRYQLTCLHVHHSLGVVKAGELCLFVFTSAPRRKAAIAACGEVVERIKSALPIWGKEIFDNASVQWKQNT